MTTNTAHGLPDCPSYIAHPQAVWFEEHWRPIFNARDEEVRRLESGGMEMSATIEMLLAENKRLREALDVNAKLIAVMRHDLLTLGVNFDFQKAPERWAALKDRGGE